MHGICRRNHKRATSSVRHCSTHTPSLLASPEGRGNKSRCTLIFFKQRRKTYFVLRVILISLVGLGGGGVATSRSQNISKLINHKILTAACSQPHLCLLFFRPSRQGSHLISDVFGAIAELSENLLQPGSFFLNHLRNLLIFAILPSLSKTCLIIHTVQFFAAGTDAGIVVIIRERCLHRCTARVKVQSVCDDDIDLSRCL